MTLTVLNCLKFRNKFITCFQQHGNSYVECYFSRRLFMCASMFPQNMLPISSFTLCRHYATRGKNHYDILELKKNANPDQIKKAYYKQVKKYHPDKNNSADAKAKYAQISDAYEILSNPISKRDYDVTMRINQYNYKPEGQYSKREGQYSQYQHYRQTQTQNRRARQSTSQYGYGKYSDQQYTDEHLRFYWERMKQSDSDPTYNYEEWLRKHYRKDEKGRYRDRRYERTYSPKVDPDIKKVLDIVDVIRKFIYVVVFIPVVLVLCGVYFER